MGGPGDALFTGLINVRSLLIGRMEQSVMPSLTTINLTCTLGQAAPSDMTILEAIVALSEHAHQRIKGLSFKVLTFHHNVIPVTGWANTDPPT